MKFHAKIKLLTFRTKNALFGYFWFGIRKIDCHIGNKHPPICLIANFDAKIKILKFRTKIVLIGCFKQQL